LKIKVFEVGAALIDADDEYQEPAIRAALEAGGDVADVIADYTDTDRSNISTDDYAVVFEDDGTLLHHGWLSGDRNAEPPPQARRWFAEMSAADRVAPPTRAELACLTRYLDEAGFTGDRTVRLLLTAKEV